MNALVFPADSYSSLAAELLGRTDETCAVLLASVVRRGAAGSRLLVQQVVRVPDDSYRRRGPLEAELAPAFVAEMGRRARLAGRALVFVHTHPGSVGVPSFSPADDRGEVHLGAFLDRRVPGKPHAALVVGRGGCRARRLSSGEPIAVLEVGEALTTLYDPTGGRALDPSLDRQVRAFGAKGQERLQKLRVAIVGLGGTGSMVAEQLAHLGVSDFLLVDPDVVEATNLNRLVGATPADVGKEKVGIAGRLIRSVRSESAVDARPESILEERTASLLAATDFIFCCTDSHGSRAVIGQLAYQYLVPCIDVGVVIAVAGGAVTHVAGRVQMLSPGLACLVCGNLLDSNAVRHDLMTPFERRADPYFVGGGEPQPAVVSVNGTVASLAVTMFLAAVAGIPARPRYQLYNALSGTVRVAALARDPNCIVCSPHGALARGEEWPLPVRRS